jgi:hypothetical protein
MLFLTDPVADALNSFHNLLEWQICFNFRIWAQKKGLSLAIFYLWEWNVRFKNVHNKVFINRANYQLKAVHAICKHTPVNKYDHYKTS